jgi:hypothetical protein
LNSINDNPISLDYKKRYNMQSQEVKEKLDNFRSSDYQLRIIEKTKPKINIGDVFLLSPRENVYFYGKVLKTNIKTINNDTFVEGKHTVFIHKCRTNKKSMDDYNPNYDDLLINPSIVDISYWKSGFFYTIGNLPLTKIEQTLDYGFYKLGIPGIRDGWFCTEEGKKIDCQPKIKGIYGVATITGIAAEIEKRIIMNPFLIK